MEFLKQRAEASTIMDFINKTHEISIDTSNVEECIESLLKNGIIINKPCDGKTSYKIKEVNNLTEDIIKIINLCTEIQMTLVFQILKLVTLDDL